MRSLGYLGLLALAALLAAGCVGAPPVMQPEPQSRSASVAAPRAARPISAAPATPPAQAAPPQPVPAPAQAPRRFQLGPAAAALVGEAREEAANGNAQLALSTVERALRIEPRNPRLWILLGQAHEGAGQYELAGSMGRKALQLAAGDPDLQSRAWRLIGDSLRARGRNQEADRAYSRADALTQR